MALDGMTPVVKAIISLTGGVLGIKIELAPTALLTVTVTESLSVPQAFVTTRVTVYRGILGSLELQ